MGFPNMTKAQVTTAKNKQVDYFKGKSFCTAEELINKTKRQPIQWEKMLANHISNNGLISKTHTNQLQNTNT